MNSQINVNSFTPDWMIWIQAICFSTLYAIWALPETILIRHICLIIGALLGLWILMQNRSAFFQIRAMPVWLLVALFAWGTVHLLFLANDFSVQLGEFASVWKRSAIGAIFALSFGIALSGMYRRRDPAIKPLITIIFLGVLAPTLIYIVKFALTYMAVEWGVKSPAYWQLYQSSAPYYLPKTNYVFFCLPLLALALGGLHNNIQKNQWFRWESLVLCVSIFAVFFVFFAGNIKNGVIYSFSLLIVFLVMHLGIGGWRRYILVKCIFVALICALSFYSGKNYIERHESWSSFKSDVNIAWDTQQYQHWKSPGGVNYPLNANGNPVHPTNYDRVAWIKIGLSLVPKHPLGYGLIDGSFGRLAKIYWPDSRLHQSHSGWLDLILGIGVPGVALIWGSIIFILLESRNSSTAFRPVWILIRWLFLGLVLMWFTTELSERVFFDALVFWIALASGVCIADRPPISPSEFTR